MDDYRPHALLGILYIYEQENVDEQNRDYSPSVIELEQAKTLIKDGEDAAQLDQLEDLIQRLRNGGWI